MMERLADTARVWRSRIGRLRVLLTAPKNGVCAEIGVWKGDFSRRIVQFCKPRELHLVDPWKFDPAFPARMYGGTQARSQADMDAIMQSVAGRFRDVPAVKIHRGPSVDVVSRFGDGFFDWIYIDGDHSTGAVLEDLRAWNRKVKSGGIIALDDYDWHDEADEFSVRKAIRQFLSEQKVRAAKSMQGQFLIRTI